MKKEILDILKIVGFASIFVVIISLFPQVTLEGAFITGGCLLFIFSLVASNAYKKSDRRVLKNFISEKNQKFFDKNDQPRISKKKAEEASKKMIIAGVIMLALSYLSFYFF